MRAKEHKRTAVVQFLGMINLFPYVYSALSTAIDFNVNIFLLLFILLGYRALSWTTQGFTFNNFLSFLFYNVKSVVPESLEPSLAELGFTHQLIRVIKEKQNLLSEHG